MSDALSRMGEFAARLLSGGTLEIVLLIVLIVVGVVLLLVALWILWKLLVLLGKGLVWLFRNGGDVLRKQSATRREERLAAPPPVATGWGSSPRIGLRKALGEARRRAGPDALRIVLVAGAGMADLCRSLGLTPPGAGTIGIAASGDTILIDAARADSGRLRALASALPWQRPVDAVAVTVDRDGIPPEALVRAAGFARAAGLRVGLHFVVPSSSPVAAWRVVESDNRDGGDLCMQLAQDGARIWLTGGPRSGLKELSLAQFGELSTALDRAFAAAPSSSVDMASLCLSGAGLRSAVAQTAARTRPAETPGLSLWAGAAGLAAGAALAVLVTIVALDRTDGLRSAVSTAEREAAAPWHTTDIDAVPSGARVRRVAGVSALLAGYSDFSLLAPLAILTPNHDAPARLGGALLDAFVLRPLALGIDREARGRLQPSTDPEAWLGDAQVVGEWLAAWEGLSEDPEEVDLRRLLAAAFGGEPDTWPEGLDLALVRTEASPPPPVHGGLDVDELSDLARRNFIATMQRWAESVYANGPVASAAKRAIDRSANWREQHAALSDLRAALQDPGQLWLTAAEDRPDYGFEIRLLGRALALAVLGQAIALEAKAAVSRIRIDAREAAQHFTLTEVGPLMVRWSTGTQGGGGAPSLSLSGPAQAWLAFLDRVNADFGESSQSAVASIAGPVTIDATMVARNRARLSAFDRFAADLPPDLPPAAARNLLTNVASELVVGVASDVESALRPAGRVGLAREHAQRLAQAAQALDDLGEIEVWLRERQANFQAERVASVRSRVAENVLAAGAVVLAEEDPIGVYLDPAADAGAMVRRFERGVERLRRLYEQLGAPYVDSAALRGGAIALEWRDIGDDIAGYDRGDAEAALSGLEGALHAWADGPDDACAAPQVLRAEGRDDYVARALARYRAQFEQECDQRRSARARAALAALSAYFRSNLAWMWPFSRDTKAPELPSATLGDFVSRLQESQEALASLEGGAVESLRANAKFWKLDDSGVAVRFRAEWRARPGEEHLAEHLMAHEFVGAEKDDGGIHVWRYGTPVALKLRLAKNSPYRFENPSDVEGLELEFSQESNGALLRILDGLSNGAFLVAARVLDEAGARQELRLTARIAYPDGEPMTLPRFSEYPMVQQ